jgi:phosphoglycolate phosphatase-like HAD superfamily hydrolase
MHIVLFDIDGTLISSGGAGRLALSRAFEKAHNWDNALDGATVHGMTDPVIIEDVFMKHRQTPPTASEAARIYGLYLQALENTLEEADGFRVLPGVGRLLARLSAREDTVTGLATGNIEKGARMKLRHARLNKRFGFGGFGSDASDRGDIVRVAEKRAMEFLLEAAKPATWLVGDTPNDVAAGKSANARTVAVATGGASAERLRETRPDVLLNDLSDCDAFLSMLDSAAEENGSASSREGRMPPSSA